jgi:hypothetical protein
MPIPNSPTPIPTWTIPSGSPSNPRATVLIEITRPLRGGDWFAMLPGHSRLGPFRSCELAMQTALVFGATLLAHEIGESRGIGARGSVTFTFVEVV